MGCCGRTVFGLMRCSRDVILLNPKLITFRTDRNGSREFVQFDLRFQRVKGLGSSDFYETDNGI